MTVDRPADERTDQELLRAHVEGDAEAFGVLFGRHRDRLWAAIHVEREPVRRRSDDPSRQRLDGPFRDPVTRPVELDDGARKADPNGGARRGARWRAGRDRRGDRRRGNAD